MGVIIYGRKVVQCWQAVIMADRIKDSGGLLLSSSFIGLDDLEGTDLDG